MKIVKIVIAALLLYGAGTEYIHAGKQLTTFFSPPIIFGCLVIILISAWLLGSALNNNKFQIRSIEFIKYFFFSLLGFFAFAFFALISYKSQPDIITANGVKVNISECMNGSRNIIPDKAERRNYCTCVLNKLTGDSKISTRFSAELQRGQIDKIIIAVSSDTDFYKLKLNECMSSLKNFHWTETFEKSTRERMYEQVKHSELSNTNNIDMYCDCLIQEYKKLPMNEITNPDFFQSPKSISIDSLCNSKSILK